MLYTLYNANDLELAICGQYMIDIDLLQRHTQYSDDININDTYIQWFWHILKSYSNHLKQQFIRFTWAIRSFTY